MDVNLTYKLSLKDRTGSIRKILYQPHTSKAVWEDSGFPLSLGFAGMDYAPPDAMKFKSVDPHDRSKSTNIRTLKIQLGLNCNLACSYCSQAHQPKETQGNMKDVREFLGKLPLFYDGGDKGDGSGTVVEFWGGEPFAYWKTLKHLVSVMRMAYPKAEFQIITNGTLFTDEIIEWIVQMGIRINISHDGPVYTNQRDARDPLMNSDQRAMIRKLYDALWPSRRIGFGAVLTRNNSSLKAVKDYICEKLEIDPNEIHVTTEEIILPYDQGGLDVSPQNDDEQRTVMETTYWEAVTAHSMSSGSVRGKVEDFFRSLAQQRPSTALGQKCGMDKKDTLAVDLKGNALTCHNTSADTRHKIGHIDEFEKIELHTLNHWQTDRVECVQCPVVQLCRGACFFIEGDLWTKACDNSFHYNLGLLGAALYYLTRRVLVEIEGPVMRRSDLPKVVSVITAPEKVNA